MNIYIRHNDKDVRKQRNIKDKVYVFTSWGLVKGTIVKDRIDRNSGIPQYKVDIEIDYNNKNISYNFWYTSDQMSRTKFTAMVKELFRPIKVKLNNNKVVNEK